MQVCRAFVSGCSKFLHLCNKCTTLAHSRSTFSAIYIILKNCARVSRVRLLQPDHFKSPSYPPVAEPQISGSYFSWVGNSEAILYAVTLPNCGLLELCSCCKGARICCTHISSVEIRH